MSYSPDGSLLAVGNHDSVIYLYETVNYKEVGKCTGHSAAIIDLDWDKESSALRTFSLSYDLLYYNTKGDRIKDAYSLKDTEWNTNTCKQGFNVTGIWNRDDYEGTDDINNILTNEEQNLLVTGDDSRRVNIFNYPAPLNYKDVK